MLKCHICSQQCENIIMLTKHARRHTKAELVNHLMGKDLQFTETNIKAKRKRKGQFKDKSAQTSPFTIPKKEPIVVAEVYACNLCKMEFGNKMDFECHCSSHYYVLFRCHYCDLFFNDKTSINAHLDEHLMESVLNCTVDLEQEYKRSQYVNVLADAFQAGYRYGQRNKCKYDPIKFQKYYLEQQNLSKQLCSED